MRLSEEPQWKRYQAQLEALAALPLNFDLERRHEYTAANGWHIDDFEADLPPEPPGPPVENGSWMIARQMIREYRFPDPSIVTGLYVPDLPLDRRVMLLRARAFGLTFYFGVKVGGVIDEVCQSEAGPQQVWGFYYQTLKGHYERGQMDFMAIKWLDSGKVAFHIHAFSQAGEIANPILRLGFRLLGRRVQKRFIRRSLERMQQLVHEQLVAQARGVPAPTSMAESVPVQPASADAQAAEKMEQVQEQVSSTSSSR